MAGANSCYPTAAGQPSQAVPVVPTASQYHVLVSGGQTPGDPLPRIQGSRPGYAGYFQDLEDWKDLACLNRVRHYTIELMAAHMNSQGKVLAYIYLLRNAENHVPLLLMSLDCAGNLSVSSLDGTATIISANNCHQVSGRSNVCAGKHGKVGEVSAREIRNNDDEIVYDIIHHTNDQTCIHFVSKVADTSETPDRLNTISGLPNIDRVLVQLMQLEIDERCRALNIVFAMKFLPQLFQEHRNQEAFALCGDDIHETLFDEICKVPLLPLIELPTDRDVKPNDIDLDLIRLVSVNEATIKIAASNPIMYKKYYFVKDVMAGEIILVGENNSVQATPDFRFRNINSRSTLLWYEQQPSDKPSAVFLGHIQVGSISNATQIEREFSYTELLIAEVKKDANADLKFMFRRRFHNMNSCATITFKQSAKIATLKFDGSWDVYWKAIILSFVTKMFDCYIENVHEFAIALSLQDAHHLAYCRNSNR